LLVGAEAVDVCTPDQVEGIDQVGNTLCLPTPGESAMKSVLGTPAAYDHQQQQGRLLPHGRRVSVKSPEAIRIDADDEEDQTKRTSSGRSCGS
jgi:hypothetical protein